MNPSKTLIKEAASQEQIKAAWERAARAVPQAVAKAVLRVASKDKDKAVPPPPQVNKTRVVRVTSIPRTTIKGSLVGVMTRKAPEIIQRSIAGRTMF
jgi:hypothetical protein